MDSTNTGKREGVVTKAKYHDQVLPVERQSNRCECERGIPYDKLKRFGELRGCRCHGDVDWDVVRRFIDVGYSRWDPRELVWEVSDEQLREKIRILNVPWRSPTGR